MDAGFGWQQDPKYYERDQSAIYDMSSRITLETHEGRALARGNLYVRSAYRNDPEFTARSLSRQEDIGNPTFNRMIEVDATVAKNYQRLAAQAIKDLFAGASGELTLNQYREMVIGQVREPMQTLFGDLTLTSIGDPLEQGSFQFKKGTVENFDYKNLSGGEKAAFDLILDIVVKRQTFDDSIYLIDEPETHLNTRLQGVLLEVLLKLIPEKSQLWIASHSIGMMRKALDLSEKDPGSVSFIDFSDRNFDEPTLIHPSVPSRRFWESVLRVALDDLAALVTPEKVVVCEGDPKGTSTDKDCEYDAHIYNNIFEAEFPKVKFVSAGNSKEVQGDFIGLATVLPRIAEGVTVERLIDRDDHAEEDIEDFLKQKIRVLGRRNIESYLFDDAVLEKLCVEYGKPECAADLLHIKGRLLSDSVQRGFPKDDLKKIAGRLYVETARLLALTRAGNSPKSFARNTLSKLITPDTVVYQELKATIFE